MARRDLPPLNALRGFEAAARHLSFSLAAEELGVTQGAVSRQVRALEDWGGQALFRRMTRRVALTEAGQALFATAGEALDGIERGARTLRGRSRRLVLSALPTITSAWLMPRLDGFARHHPGIELRILSSIAPADLGSGEIDLAIRVGRLPGERVPRDAPRIELEMATRWAGVTAERLLPDLLVPVCRADLLPDGPPAAAALARMPLIHTSTRRHAWPDWLRAQGVRAPAGRGLSFGHFFMSLEAARKGQGVALVPDILLPPGERELVVASAARIPSAGGYVVLTHESRQDDPAVEALRGWLMREAAATRPGGVSPG